MPHVSKVFSAISKMGLQPEKKNLKPLYWLNLIEARKEAMMEQINELGQVTLGNVRHWPAIPGDDQKVRENLHPSDLISGDMKELDMKGVFMFDGRTCTPYPPVPMTQSSMLVYGFTRNGEWIKALIRFTGNSRSKEVLIERVSLVELVNDPHLDFTRPDKKIFALSAAESVFMQLGFAIERYVERRRQLASSAEDFWQRTKNENDLLEVLSEDFWKK